MEAGIDAVTDGKAPRDRAASARRNDGAGGILRDALRDGRNRAAGIMPACRMCSGWTCGRARRRFARTDLK